jgi:hypothetical protein
VKRNLKTTLAMLSILLFSSLLVSSFTVTPSKAVDYTQVGVKVGDWAYYSGTTNITGLPPNFEGNFTVTKIDRSNVTGTFSVYNTNGVFVGSQTIWGNISSGVNGPPGAVTLFWFLLVPNLTTKGDMVFANSPGLWINDTGIMIAAGRARPYAHINVTTSGNTTDVHVDQATGIGMQVNLFMWNGVNHLYLTFKLTSTSLWSPPIYNVGVNVGDWAYYSVRSATNGLDSGLRNANLTVVSIDRGNVTLTDKEFCANGTIKSMGMWGNVSSGVSNVSIAFAWFLAAANLGKNDPLTSTATIWINGTFSLIILGEARACNYLNVSSTSIGAYLSWDQATGITTKGNITGLGGSGNYERWNMTSTSLWSPAPTINQPSAITYTFGSTGHTITWTPSSNVPSDYTITRNGTTIASGIWGGASIISSVDGLAVDTYVYTCTVNDTIGRTATSTVIVTVTAAPPPPPSGLSPYVIVAVGGIAVAVVVVVAAVVMLRRRKT